MRANVAEVEGTNELTHPGEQSPVGASRPEELQYLPGGQGTHWFTLESPNWPLNVPLGQGKLTPDSAPIENTLNIERESFKFLIMLSAKFWQYLEGSNIP